MEKRIIELYRRKFDDIRHEADGIEALFGGFTTKQMKERWEYRIKDHLRISCQHLPLPQKILQLK